MQRVLLVANPAASGFTAMLHRTVVAALGTSNVFARLTGHPRRGADAANALAAADRVISLPTIRLQFAGAAGTASRVATFAAGLGYDADVIRESERRPLGKVGAGTLHYTVSAVRVALGRYRSRPRDITVTVDGDEPHRAVTVITQVHDRYTFFGRRALTLSPAGPAVVTIEQATPWRLIRVMGRAARHRHPGVVPGVRVAHPFSRLEATADETVPLEADGEYLGEVASLVAVVEPDSLRLLDPRSGH